MDADFCFVTFSFSFFLFLIFNTLRAVSNFPPLELTIEQLANRKGSEQFQGGAKDGAGGVGVVGGLSEGNAYFARPIQLKIGFFY